MDSVDINKKIKAIDCEITKLRNGDATSITKSTDAAPCFYAMEFAASVMSWKILQLINDLEKKS